MANVALTQIEADGLLVLEKHRVDDRVWSPPGRGGKISVPLASVDGRESFFLWAFPVPLDHFSNVSDATQTLQDFMDYCNVTRRPRMQLELFP